MAKTMKPDVFEYLDYRIFFQDLFQSLKNENPRFSLRAFSKLAGSSSPNFLQLIVARKLNIHPAGLSRLAVSLRLSRKEETFLENLVGFDHAKTHEEKDKFYQRILRDKHHVKIKKLQKNQYQYFSQWYHPVVREIMIQRGYNGHPEWISDRLVPRVTIPKIKESVKLLKSLGLVIFNESSFRWEQADSIIATPSTVLSLAAVNFHRNMIDLARQSLTRFGARERDVRSVTLGLSQEGYGVLKKKVALFWKEVMALGDNQKNPDMVFQFNSQLFPLAKKKADKK